MSNDIIERLDFDPGDWNYIKSREDLIEELRDYKREFQINEWTEETISHFLQLKDWLISQGPHLRHIRTLYTILSEVDL